MPRLPFLRRAVATAAVSTLVVGAAAVALAAPASATTATVTYTSGSNSFTVPAGVSALHVEALGGSGASMYGQIAGGAGGLVTADLPVTSGTTYTAVVGGNGGSGNGGANGGGNGAVSPTYGTRGAGGGGASDIRTTAGDLGSRVLVAAGGGGGSQWAGTVGGAAGSAAASSQCGSSAQPGTASAGGGAGSCYGANGGTAGTLGTGGNGGLRDEGNNVGGGGGGGLYGGGGGDAFGGGAGGSNFVTAAASNTSTVTGALGAAPYIRITYLRPALNGVTVSTSVPSLTADGTSTLVATAHLTNVVASTADGEAVRFSSSAGNTFGAVTDNGDGTYSATMTATTAVVDAARITASVDDGTQARTGTTSFAQTVGATDSLAVSVTPGSVTADGTSTATIDVVTADAYGHPTRPTGVTLSTSNGVTTTPVVQSEPGHSTSTIRATTTAGTVTITATDSESGLSDSAELTQVAGPVTTVTPRTPAESVAADGTSAWSVTTTLADANGNPVSGAAPVITTTDPEVEVGDTTDDGDGSYTTALTPSTTLGAVTVTATVGTVTGTTTYRQVVGAPSAVQITSAPVTSVADGSTTSTVTATVTDAAGHPLAGLPVTWSSDDADQRISDVTDNGDGTYSAVIRASTTVGEATLTASVDDVDTAAATQTITQTIGAPAVTDVTAADRTVTADGTSTTDVVATIADAYGHAIVGLQPVVAASDAGVALSAVTDLGDGRYGVTATASTTAGTVTFSVTAGGATGTTEVRQVAGAAAVLRLAVGTPVDQGDGTFVTSVTATVTDAHGNPVSGSAPTFRTVDERAVVSEPVDNGDGTYTVTVTAPAGVSTDLAVALGDLTADTTVPGGIVVVPVPEPTDPTDPEPTDPTVPVTPSDPTDPVTPSDPVAVPTAPSAGAAPIGTVAPTAVRKPAATEAELAYTGTDGLVGTGLSALLLLTLGLGLRLRRRRRSA
ncbi:invasin domain 3-containing protein [Curtobacterium sp. PhB115]|uniref:beta strand repeat-containing protein n=1 Tax=Curtobacterium sp. PhB115 TaxID=2485173 RepID=UPI000F4CF930|nr:invasin domain 3-containing protein [Curtobacterium sp. PhB115]ROP74608.1 invasin-like protein [Curtobacterium sp. PhB115]